VGVCWILCRWGGPLAASRQVRIYGSQRSELDVDVMVQVLILLGRELEQRARQDCPVQGTQDEGETRDADQKGTSDGGDAS
jgi:hypothetical protein